MHRIDGPGAGAGGTFQDGNPSTATPSTILIASWMNALQEELLNILEKAGVEPSKADNAQLSKVLAIAAGEGGPFHFPEGAFVGGDNPANLLNSVEAGVFDPVFTFATPTDVSVSYANRAGFYLTLRVAGTRFVYVFGRLNFTPTFTTGEVAGLTNLPFPANNSEGRAPIQILWLDGGGASIPTLPAGSTQFVALMGNNQAAFNIRGNGSGAAGPVASARFTSASAYALHFAGLYVGANG